LSAFALPRETKLTKYFIFILFRLFRFSLVVQKQTFGEVGTKTVIWWQVVSIVFAPKIIKICQSLFKSQSMMFGVLFDIFSFILTHILLVLFSLDSAETDIGWDGILKGYLMTSCARNICTENYWNWISLLQVMCWCVFSETACIYIFCDCIVPCILVYFLWWSFSKYFL